MQQPFPQPFMQVTTLPLYTAFSKEDHNSCRNLECFPWLGFHRTGSSDGRTCRRTWTFAWFKGLTYTYEGTVEVISGDWMLNSPSSVLSIIIDNYFNIHFFHPSAHITNCYVTTKRNEPCSSNTITTLVVSQMLPVRIEAEYECDHMVVSTAKTYTRVWIFWFLSGDDELSTGFFRPKTYTGKTVSVNAMKKYGGSTGIGPLSFNLDAVFRWEVSLLLRPLCIRAKDARYPLNRTLGGHQNQSGCFGEVIRLLALPRMEPRIVQPTVQSLYRLCYPGSHNFTEFKYAPGEKIGYYL